MKKLAIILVLILAILGGYKIYKIVNTPVGNQNSTSESTSETLETAQTGNSDTATTTAETMSVNIYLVQLEKPGEDDMTYGNEKIGCNDTIVAIKREIPKTPKVLEASLKELFKINDRELKIGNETYYNALYQSDIQYNTGSLSPEGVATIKLSGTMQSGGICDDPRIIAQIKKTVEQFLTVKSSKIFINDVTLEEYFSQR